MLHRHPADKDATDIELALDAALAARARPDRWCCRRRRRTARPRAGQRRPAGVGPASPAWRSTARLGPAVVTVVRPEAPCRSRRRGRRAPVAAARRMPATGVTSRGVRWPLATPTCSPVPGAQQRGDRARRAVACATGVLLVVLPGERVADVPRRRPLRPDRPEPGRPPPTRPRPAAIREEPPMIVELQVLPTPSGTPEDRHAHVEAAIAVIQALRASTTRWGRSARRSRARPTRCGRCCAGPTRPRSPPAPTA